MRKNIEQTRYSFDPRPDIKLNELIELLKYFFELKTLDELPPALENNKHIKEHKYIISRKDPPGTLKDK